MLCRCGATFAKLLREFQQIKISLARDNFNTQIGHDGLYIFQGLLVISFYSGHKLSISNGGGRCRKRGGIGIKRGADAPTDIDDGFRAISPANAQRRQAVDF